MRFTNEDLRCLNVHLFNRPRRVSNTRCEDLSNFGNVVLMISKEDEADRVVSFIRVYLVENFRVVRCGFGTKVTLRVDSVSFQANRGVVRAGRLVPIICRSNAGVEACGADATAGRGFLRMVFFVIPWDA